MNDMVKAICREMQLRKKEPAPEINTLYLGGGTPGILAPGQLTMILNEATKHFNISQGAEITLEANPDDISPLTLRAWREMGINRLSLGIQSFNDDELKWMNRSHSAEKAIRALQEIREAGFENFSVDLIFGSPLSDKSILDANLDLLLASGAPHISCYGLTVEPRTRLHKMIQKKTSKGPAEDEQAEQFLYVMSRLQDAGFEHYEISNFAKPGFRSRHNSSYWKGLPYYGFGPSAHSFDGMHTRSFNIADNRLYVNSLENEKIPSEHEVLTTADQINEFIMISLRTAEGLDLDTVYEKFGDSEVGRILSEADKYLQTGAIMRKENIIYLSQEGKLMADGIASALFV